MSHALNAAAAVDEYGGRCAPYAVHFSHFFAIDQGFEAMPSFAELSLWIDARVFPETNAEQGHPFGCIGIRQRFKSRL